MVATAGAGGLAAARRARRPTNPSITAAAPADNRPAKPPRDTNVDGNPAGRNFTTANRVAGVVLPPATTDTTTDNHGCQDF